jgi:predicted CoA-binding protein
MLYRAKSKGINEIRGSGVSSIPAPDRRAFCSNRAISSLTAPFMSHTKQRVVVLGASHKPERYANQAIRLLLEHGHDVVPVHPLLDVAEGLPVVHRLGEIDGAVDTLTLYVGPERSALVADDIVRLRPGRVIFNPGTESAELQARLDDAGIPHEQACTLVLLRTGQF